MAIYTVKRGDTLSSIARQHGIGSWQALYNDPSNVAFRAKRPNPNLIFPGDQINIPGTGPMAGAAGAAKGQAGIGANAAKSPMPYPAQAAAKLPGDPPDYRMAIIDGTGPGDDREYSESMKNSFCKQLGNALEHKKIGRYWRGPGAAGTEVDEEAAAAAGYLLAMHDTNPNLRLMLAGYSRGGSAAIMAAEILEKQNVPVDALFLFDAVARHIYSGGEVIPKNVHFSRHARRELNWHMVLKYEGTFSDVGGVVNMSNPMRPSFGNTGLTWRGDGDHLPAKPFKGTHGALGGVGWGFVPEDIACQKAVAKWMNEQLASRHAWHGLKSIPPAPAKAAKVGAVELVTGWAIDVLMLLKHEKNLSKAGTS
jgi:hypothetical protein